MAAKGRIIMIHGYGTNAMEMTWMQKAKQDLEKRGYEVKLPTFPNSSFPVFAEWEETFYANAEGWVEFKDLTIIGHSLGAAFAFMLANNIQLKKIIAIAPGYVGHISKEEYFSRSKRDQATKEMMYKFFEDGGKINPDIVREMVGSVTLMYSGDDTKIADYTKEFFVNQLHHDNYYPLENYGHFMTIGENPIHHVPELVEWV